MEQKYLLTIAYDGSNYSGWQFQPNALSVQEVIETAFETILKKPLRLLGSSRTDAGVHALDQKAQVVLEEPVDPKTLLYSLNGLLPLDIRIKEMKQVSPDFHVRFNAKKKTYHYHLVCDLFGNPCKRAYAFHVPHRFDLDKVKEAIPYFIGTHNFKAFANESSKGAASTSPIKTIYDIKLVEEVGGYRLEFEGSGFLYKMVRNIVGTLLECAKGKLSPKAIPGLMASLDRRQVPKSAPAHGLFLVKIEY
jgi:tRNA pseudouridine38-40 synthase